MVDVTKLSAAKLQALYDKRQAACSANCTALINAGRGMERGGEIYAKGKAGADPLSIEYVETTDAVREVIDEQEARKRWHGSLKPIRRATALHDSPTTNCATFACGSDGARYSATRPARLIICDRHSSPSTAPNSWRCRGRSARRSCGS
jgi:hypothetical protein